MRDVTAPLRRDPDDHGPRTMRDRLELPELVPPSGPRRWDLELADHRDERQDEGPLASEGDGDARARGVDG